ncbi:MAG: hypothetical protein IJ494_01480 [Bacteroides sp.]|nr:hypothetical protein [Bacteroides sp.]
MKTKKMMKVLLPMVGIVLFLIAYSCENDGNELWSEYQYIDFTPDEPRANQGVVIQIAAERLNDYVTFENDHFIMAPCSPEKLGLSIEVFEYMKMLMKLQNENLSQYEYLVEIDTNLLCTDSESLSDITSVRTRTESATPAGGVDKTESVTSFYGTTYYCYISNKTLARGGYLSSAAALALVKMGGVVVTLCGASSVLCQALAVEYPNGIILTVTVPIDPVYNCVTYTIKGQ